MTRYHAVMTNMRRVWVHAVAIVLSMGLTVAVVWRAGMTRRWVEPLIAVSQGELVRPIELRVWDWWSPAANEEHGYYFDEIKRTFEQRNPGVKVIYQMVPFTNYVQKLATAMVGSRPPDVFESSVYWAEGFYQRGMLLPLNNLLATDGGDTSETRITEEAFLPAAWKHNHTADGTVFGIPQIIDANCLIWNLDLLQAASADNEQIRNLFVTDESGRIDYDRIRFDAIRNWDHFRQVMKLLTAFDENGVMTRSGYVLTAYDGGVGLFTPWLASNGGRYQDAAGTKAMFDSPNGVQTMDFIAQLRWKDEVCPPFRRVLSPSDLFTEGAVACILAGTWSGKDIRRDTQGWQHFGKTAFPPGPMGAGQRTVSWGNMMVISRKCRNLDIAWRYIKFVCSLEGNLIRLKHLGYNGPRLDFYETAQWARAVEQSPYLSNIKDICLSGDKLRHTEIAAANHQANPIFQTVLLRYPAIAEGNGPYQSVATALSGAADAVDAVFYRFNRQVESWRFELNESND